MVSDALRGAEQYPSGKSRHAMGFARAQPILRVKSSLYGLGQYSKTKDTISVSVMSDENAPRSSDPVVSCGSWNVSMFGSPIRHYAEILKSRVMPLFDDLDGEQ